MIVTMDLIEIDVIDAETPEARVDRVPDVFLRGTLLVWGVSRRIKCFRSNNDFFSAYSQLLQRPASDFLAHALGIQIGCIEEVDPGFECLLEKRERGFFI